MHILRPLRIVSWQVTGKYPFHSNDEFFGAVMALLTRLEHSGYSRAAAELRRGFGCLNGLTDGAALFLDSIAKVQAEEAAHFTREDQRTLETLRTVLHRIVYFPR